MNNRIIKYRAWDNKRKKMIDFENIEMMQFGQDVPLPLAYFFDDEDIIMLEFTGLTDKNGKEIYENHIIETKGYVTVVRYEAPSFCCRYDKGNAEMMDFDSFEECEVIGNIYQNSELLTIIN